MIRLCQARNKRGHVSCTHPTDAGPTHGTDGRQYRRSQNPTLEQNLQRGNVVDNHGPADGRCRAGEIVPPDQQQQGEQLREARDEQRRADDGRVRVAWEDVR